MKTNSRRQGPTLWGNYLPIAIFCVVVALISYFIGDVRYTQRVLLLILIWAAASSCFNIISGYGGQTVFGFMMFIGAGAYTSVLLFKFLGISPWLGIVIGAIIACAIALFIGLPTLRLRGAFFAMTTMAFPLIAYALLCNVGLEEVTIPYAGPNPGSLHFADTRHYVLLALVLLSVILVIIRWIETSRFGFSLKALKQNETAAEGIGIDTYKTKLMAFMLSAFLGGIIGTIYAFSILLVITVHSAFGLFIIVRILAFACIGGLSTLWGPVVGAAILVPIGEYLNSKFGGSYPGLQDIIYGVALIVAIIYMPEGIWGKVLKALRRPAEKLAGSVKPIRAEASDVPNIDKQERAEPFKFEQIEPKTREKRNGSILKIEGVSKSFGGVMALKNLDIAVPRGKVLGIIGPNGSGKTTLFNVIHGYLRPEKGRIFFEGEGTTHLKPHTLCRLGIGRTFQVPQIFHNMTVVENIMVGAFANDGNVAKARAVSEKVAMRMGLGSRIHDYAVGLNAWETKMVEFGRAVATQPKLLLVDEPMAGLNPEETHRIGELIKAIANSGVTVIVIEHVVQSLVKIADVMVGLDQGQKVAEGTPGEVTSNPHMIEAYLGPKWRERYAKT
ncbi:MAG: branched-chain amino acid ABC transporter ATP-binding protein/permease [Thermodesulfobacteriota bacterium]|jgi:branched-chain amino acid transport system permease protein